MRSSSASTRFLAKVDKQDNGCWLWTGALDTRGYGQFRPGAGAPMVGAHRASYEMFVGPIPDGLEIDHLCFTLSCVKPEHLEAVTHEVNVQRWLAAFKTHCKNGHLRVPVNQYKSGRCRLCQAQKAKRYRERKANASLL